MKTRNAGIIGAALLAAATISEGALVIFSDNFESRNVGTINGQDSWNVVGGSTNDAVVVSDPSRAYQGSQFLAAGTLGTGPRILQQSISALPVDTVSNYILSMSVRLESYYHNGLRTILNGNFGPSYAVDTWINSLGHFYEVTGSGNNYPADYTDLGGPPLNTGEWYNVTYLVRPSANNYDITVVRAVNNTTNISTTVPFGSLPGNNPITTWTSLDLRLDAGPNNNFLLDNVSFIEIPEPSTLALLGLCVSASCMWRWFWR